MTLKDLSDAHGHAFWDHLKGRRALEVIERDDGYIDAIDSETYFTSHLEWPSIERKAIRYARGRVLDIGCGAGRVALHLQKKGFDVTGLDLSPYAIRVCKLRGVKKLRLGSLHSLRFRPASFETLVMFGNNFNLVGTPEGAKRFLRRAQGITTAQGRILAETVDPYSTDEPVHLNYHNLNRSKGRMCGQIRIRVLYKQYRSEWFDFLFVSMEEMKHLLAGTSWSVERFLTSGGPQYIAVLKKVVTQKIR